MSQARDSILFEGRPDWPMWVILTVFGVIVIGLAVSSGANYTSVVVAQSGVTIVHTASPAFDGTYPNGSLSPSGSLNVTLSLRVNNPSARTLHLQLLAFGAWIEDGPAEAGLNEARRLSDGRLPNPGGDRYFYQLFSESTEVSEERVPAAGNASYDFTYLLSGAINPSRFNALRNITDYWLSTDGAVSADRWVSWVRVQLVIDGVPPASSPTSAPYLRTIGRIEREEGLNLAR